MHESGQEPLGAFALQILRPTWIGGKPQPSERWTAAWAGTGVSDVPVSALREGLIVFEFDRSTAYSGGGVPSYELEGGRKIPQHIADGHRARIELGYKRIKYMNAFLFALYSGISTKQHTATQVQDLVDPTNYFIASRESGQWQIFSEFDRDVSLPPERSDNIRAETLDHAIEILRCASTAYGESWPDVLTLTYASCVDYSRHQFASAHLIAWSVVEALINHLWTRLHDEADAKSGGHTKMNRKRRELLAGRDYTAGVVSQFLSLSGKIDDHLLERLDKTRKARNSFAHGLAPISSDDAGNAIRLATDLIGKTASIRVDHHLSLSYWI